MTKLSSTNEDLKLYPFHIQTSLVGSKKAPEIIHQALCIKLQLNHPIDGSIVKVKAIVTNAISYIVLLGGVVLYPMGFTLDLWGEMTSYRLGWQFKDARVYTFLYIL
jgi:hypothetical protein